MLLSTIAATLSYYTIVAYGNPIYRNSGATTTAGDLTCNPITKPDCPAGYSCLNERACERNNVCEDDQRCLNTFPDAPNVWCDRSVLNSAGNGLCKPDNQRRTSPMPAQFKIQLEDGRYVRACEYKDMRIGGPCVYTQKDQFGATQNVNEATVFETNRPSPIGPVTGANTTMISFLSKEQNPIKYIWQNNNAGNAFWHWPGYAITDRGSIDTQVMQCTVTGEALYLRCSLIARDGVGPQTPVSFDWETKTLIKDTYSVFVVGKTSRTRSARAIPV